MRRPAGDAHLIAMLARGWARLELTRRSAFMRAPGRTAYPAAAHDALLDLPDAHADADEIELSARQHELNTPAAVTRHDEDGAVARATRDSTDAACLRCPQLKTCGTRVVLE